MTWMLVSFATQNYSFSYLPFMGPMCTNQTIRLKGQREVGEWGNQSEAASFSPFLVLILETQHLFSENSKGCAFVKGCLFFIFYANFLRERKINLSVTGMQMELKTAVTNIVFSTDLFGCSIKGEKVYEMMCFFSRTWKTSNQHSLTKVAWKG